MHFSNKVSTHHSPQLCHFCMLSRRVSYLYLAPQEEPRLHSSKSHREQIGDKVSFPKPADTRSGMRYPPSVGIAKGCLLIESNLKANMSRTPEERWGGGVVTEKELLAPGREVQEAAVSPNV